MKKLAVSVITVLIVAIAVCGGFILGAKCAMTHAVYVGESGENGYIISYRFGSYWENHLYLMQNTIKVMEG